MAIIGTNPNFAEIVDAGASSVAVTCNDLSDGSSVTLGTSAATQIGSTPKWRINISFSTPLTSGSHDYILTWTPTPNTGEAYTVFNWSDDPSAFLDGAVWVSAGATTTGNAFPLGTPADPVDNLTDAKTIADRYSLKRIIITDGNLTLPALTWDGFGFESRPANAEQVSLALANRSVSGCTLNNLTVTGQMNGSCVLDRCIVGTAGITDCDADFWNCKLVGDVTQATSGRVHWSGGYADPTAGTISTISGGSNANVVISDFTGALQIGAMTGGIFSTVVEGFVLITAAVNAPSGTIRTGSPSGWVVNLATAIGTYSSSVMPTEVWGITRTDQNEAGTFGETINELDPRIPGSGTIAIAGDQMDLVNDAVDTASVATGAIDADALATDAVNEIRDSILSDSTAFQGADIAAILADTAAIEPLVSTNLDATISSRSDFDETTDPVELLDAGGTAGTSASELVTDIDTQLSGAHGSGQWDATAAITQQEVRDAMKLAPTVGAPAAGSVDEHLDDILADTNETQGKLPTNAIGDQTLLAADHATTQAAIGALNDLAQSDILSDATPFAGGNIDAAISSRSDFDESTDPVELLDSGGAAGTSAAELVADIGTDLSTTHGSGSWEGDSAATIDATLSASHGAGNWEGDSAATIDATLSASHGSGNWEGDSAATIDATLSASHGSGSWEGDTADTIADAVWEESIDDHRGVANSVAESLDYCEQAQKGKSEMTASDVGGGAGGSEVIYREDNTTQLNAWATYDAGGSRTAAANDTVRKEKI